MELEFLSSCRRGYPYIEYVAEYKSFALMLETEGVPGHTLGRSPHDR